jgi:hypothetical protein
MIFGYVVVLLMNYMSIKNWFCKVDRSGNILIIV